MSQSSDTTPVHGGVDAAVTAFASGNPVLIHDAAGREGEVDLVYPAATIEPDDVARLRNDAGGLICVALSDSVCTTWDLPFVQNIIDHPASDAHDLRYDDRSSFSLTANHRDTFTGITDDDRALTISRLGEAAGEIQQATTVAGDCAQEAIAQGPEAFAAEFRSPGHVHLLRGAPNLLKDREGHTELGLTLANAAEVEPAVVVCEMLDDETGGARSPAAARAYADRYDIPYVEGHKLQARFG